jgi:hypothetical protein
VIGLCGGGIIFPLFLTRRFDFLSTISFKWIAQGLLENDMAGSDPDILNLNFMLQF